MTEQVNHPDGSDGGPWESHPYIGDDATAGEESRTTTSEAGATAPTSPPDSTASSTASESAGGPTRESAHEPLARTRTSAMWAGFIAFTVILVLLIVFILQNTKKVPVSFLWLNGTAPIAVAMMLSAVVGMVLTAIAGALRIRQLRKRVARAER